MSLSSRIQQLQRRLGANIAEAELARFCREGVWPTDPVARDHARYGLYFHDAVRLTVPPPPPTARGVRRRQQVRQDMIDRWMEEGRPYDRDALPSLEVTEKEAADLEAEVREWIERYQATGELPDDEELRRDLLQTIEYEDNKRRREERRGRSEGG